VADFSVEGEPFDPARPTAFSQRAEACSEGRDDLQQQMVRIRQALTDVPEDGVDTEEIARRVRRERDEALVEVARLTGEVASGLPTLTSSAMIDKRTIAEVVVEQARAHLESDEGRRELREIIEKFHEFTKKLKEASRVDPSVLREMITL